MKKKILLIIMILTATTGFSQSLGDPNKALTLSDIIATVGDTLLYIMLGISVIMLLLVTAVYFSVLSLKDKILAENDPSYKARASQTIWGRIFQVKHTSTDGEALLDHEYDGIHELNNPIPGWFMALFYGTVLFGAVYLLNYHVFKSSKLQLAEYESEVKEADANYQAYLQRVSANLNENTATAFTDAANLDKGKALFTENCVTCHGGEAQGNVGPNLTDEYWIYGGGVKNVFHTVAEGVQIKSMPSWKKKFTPIQIQQVVSYILSLQGSKPAGAKEPQGEKWTEGAAAAPKENTGDTAKTNADSTAAKILSLK